MLWYANDVTHVPESHNGSEIKVFSTLDPVAIFFVSLFHPSEQKNVKGKLNM